MNYTTVSKDDKRHRVLVRDATIARIEKSEVFRTLPVIRMEEVGNDVLVELDRDGEHRLPERVVRQRVPLYREGRNLYVTAFGVTQTLKKWARDPRCKVSYSTLRQRLATGWPTVKAITTPRMDWTHYVTAWGETKGLLAWESDPRCTVTLQTLRRRLALGASPEAAMTDPDPLKKRRVMVTAWGETKYLEEWARDPRCKVAAVTLRRRLRRGMTPESAISTPAR